MGTECYALIRGSALRVTALTPNGTVTDPARYAVSRAAARVAIDEQTEERAQELLRTEQGETRLHYAKTSQTIRYLLDIDFLRVDPGVLNIVTGVPVVRNAAGDVVGFDADTRLPAASFALEVWSKLAGRACVGGRRDWGYTLFPFLRGGTVGGFQFSDGLVSFNVQRAQTRRNPRWSVGPYDLTGRFERLLTPVSRNTTWRTFIAPIEPPAQTDGAIEFDDAIHGGTPAYTSPDILAGGTPAATSPWIVNGGRP